MKLITLGLLGLAVALGTGPAAAQDVANCARVEPGGERTLCHEIVIAAPAAEVWRLFSTSEDLNSWVAPVAAIDLRVGGTFESSYNPSSRIGAPGNIRNRVVAFAPESLLVLQVAEAPTGFPHPNEVRELTTVIALESIDEAHTRVRVTMLGYREGAAFDALYGFFDRGNALTLEHLRARVANGPTQWPREGAR